VRSKIAARAVEELKLLTLAGGKDERDPEKLLSDRRQSMSLTALAKAKPEVAMEVAQRQGLACVRSLTVTKT
jgi:hypothetical protein